MRKSVRGMGEKIVNGSGGEERSGNEEEEEERV